MLRHITVLLVTLVSPALCVPITQGDFHTLFNLGGSQYTILSFSGPGISFRFESTAPAPFCTAPSGSGCTINFSSNQLVSLVPPALVVRPPVYAEVVYLGNSYVVNTLFDPTSSLVINLSFIGSSVFVPMTWPYPNGVIGGGVSNIPFTMTGTATLVSNGVPIFANLPLSGSGLGSYSSSNPPQALEGYANQTWAFVTPEPNTWLGTCAALSALLFRASKKRV